MNRGIRITFNAPVVITFALICLIATSLGEITQGETTLMLFATSRTSLLSPLTYVRFISYVFGHADWAHFIGNMSYILILGPMLEEKYSSVGIAIVIIITALVTSIINYIFFPNTILLGASGVVFAFILLASFTNFKQGEIPLSFILVLVFYLGGQVMEGILSNDNVSQFGHIIGGLVGSIIGFKANKQSGYEDL
ncbi:MAG: rhomboid family intramembrane serine protease [Lachnospiraceae bacterium]|nr:rhomboid family intramembrane serine protease [Lachnospiraceae bacterium]